MRAKFAAVAVMLAMMATGFTVLTLWPLLRPLWAFVLEGGSPPTAQALVSRISALTAPLLLLNVIGVGVLTYLVLYFTVFRPLRRTEELVEQLESLRLELPMDDTGGPLLSAVQASLRRMAEALRREQQTTAAQLNELAATNERLTAARNELVRAEQLALLGRLAAGVAHEVGNPLMGVLGYVSLLKAKPELSKDILDYANNIEAEVQRIDGIVRGLLELGRPLRATKVPLSLSDVVSSCVRLVRAGKDFGGVNIDVSVPTTLTVMADRAMLSQVLINLLINGMQAMNGAGTLRLWTELDGRRVRLHVDDEGVGLSAEVLAEIFRPFFTTKPAGKGTGLGLAISQQLMAALDGELTASNRVPRGARFTLTLPTEA